MTGGGEEWKEKVRRKRGKGEEVERIGGCEYAIGQRAVICH